MQRVTQVLLALPELDLLVLRAPQAILAQQVVLERPAPQVLACKVLLVQPEIPDQQVLLEPQAQLVKQEPQALPV